HQKATAVKTTYESQPVDVPESFLTTPAPDYLAPTFHQISWPATAVPENGVRYAAVLDNVLSPSECAALLALAEASVPPTHGSGPDGTAGAWRPAMINVGAGYEVLTPSYRNSDRIVWDSQDVVDRIWARCLAVPGLGERLAVIDKETEVTGHERFGLRRGPGSRFEFAKINPRMRFLKYGAGQFFRAHRDAPYGETSEDGKTIESLFTIHVYLNDSKAEVGEASELVGGATSFLSADCTRKEDVDPKAGRVLIFQQRKLLHAGDDVLAGIKYTMRTEIMYELIPPDDLEGQEGQE
ncbi:hypothetical protein B0H67DRAFT_461376, partial [Lasiosphaeris hirsuta]